MKDIKLIPKINTSKVKNSAKLSTSNSYQFQNNTDNKFTSKFKLNLKSICPNSLYEISLSVINKFNYTLSSIFTVFIVFNILFYVISMIGITSLAIKENKFVYQAQKVNNELNSLENYFNTTEETNSSEEKLFVNVTRVDNLNAKKESNVKHIIINSNNYVAQN